MITLFRHLHYLYNLFLQLCLPHLWRYHLSYYCLDFLMLPHHLPFEPSKKYCAYLISKHNSYMERHKILFETETHVIFIVLKLTIFAINNPEYRILLPLSPEQRDGRHVPVRAGHKVLGRELPAFHAYEKSTLTTINIPLSIIHTWKNEAINCLYFKLVSFITF